MTLSGGECLLQIDAVEELLRACKERGLHTAVDTAGCVPFSVLERTLKDTDLYLYDVKFSDPEQHRRYTGADNRLILDNLGRLIRAQKRIWVRIPVIGGVNDSKEEIGAICDRLTSMGGVERIELLPYHAMGEKKYTALGLKPRSFVPPTESQLNALRAIVEGVSHETV